MNRVTAIELGGLFMKNAKISRRSFLLGLAACSAAGVLTACKGTDAPSGSTASSVVEPVSYKHLTLPTIFRA